MKITIGICTWNRAYWLDKALDSVRGLAVPPGVEWELIVVKNNCIDRTDEVLGRYAETLPLRVFNEDRQGVSAARNRILETADTDLLLFADDDALVTPNWLATYAKAAVDTPDVALFGGPIEPLFEDTRPPWLDSVWRTSKKRR